MNEYRTQLEQIAHNSINNQQIIATAESCTGGLIAKTLTDLAGSSQWFDCGFVTYSNSAKSRMLGVDPDIIEQYGAVSEPVIQAMCHGALTHSSANRVIAVSGVAGPSGGTAAKPVGTVWIGWAEKGGSVQTQLCHFDGDREHVRQQTLAFALDRLLEMSSNIRQ